MQTPVDTFEGCQVSLVDSEGNKTPVQVLQLQDPADGQRYIQINSTQLSAPIAVGKYDIEIECEDFYCVSEKIQFCEVCWCDIPKFKIVNCGLVYPCCSLFQSLLNSNPFEVFYNTDEAPASIQVDVRDMLEALQQFNSSLTGVFVFKDRNGNVLPSNSNLGIISTPMPAQNLHPISFCVDGDATVVCNGVTDNVSFTIELPIPFSESNQEFLIGKVDDCAGDYFIDGLILESCDFVSSQITSSAWEFNDQLSGVGNMFTVLTDGRNSVKIGRRISTTCNGPSEKQYLLEWDEDDLCGTIQITEL